MKCCITGHTRGLGKVLNDHLVNQGWTVVGFDSRNTLTQIVEMSSGCDLFINNSYANGIQIELLNCLYNSVNKMIICGSVAADSPDSELPVYSAHKKELETKFLEVADNAKSQMLLLKLSSDAYNNPNLVLKTIEFWLENPQIKVITYIAREEPNR
jgi:nucleoside-diphosphate-sugar epimerase